MNWLIPVIVGVVVLGALLVFLRYPLFATLLFALALLTKASALFAEVSG